MKEETHPYVSRGGLKLRHALDVFGVEARGLSCADLGCSTGGFTDCLLQAGAARVYAIDTGYGVLAWKLRQDPRVEVMERTNALHVEPREKVDLVVADAGWTVQRRLIPAALRWLKPGGQLISLVKPHYEAAEFGVQLPKGGVLVDEEAEHIAERVASSLPGLGARLLGLTRSPLRGGSEGNAEWLLLAKPEGP